MNLKRRFLMTVAVASAMATGMAGAAASADTIGIITPSHDNPFFKAEADGAAAQSG